MRRALVTGGSGLVGSHLVSQLLKSGGWDVHATVRGMASSAKLTAVLANDGFTIDQITLHEVDLECFAGVSSLIAQVGADVVFHTAAVVSLGVGGDKRMVGSNVDMTHFVVEAMLESGTGLLVYVSSIATFGSGGNGKLIDERCMITDISKVSAYARSKFVAENDVWRAAKMGLKVVVVNPSVILGIAGSGSECGGLQDAFRMVARGMPFYTSGVMGYVDVRDVARAMELLAMEPQSWGERYCLNGENLSYRSFVEKFGKAFSRRAPWIFTPRWLLGVGVWAMGLWSKSRCQKPLLEPFMVKVMSEKSLYDGSLVERVLGDRFRYTLISDSADYIAKRLKR